jgi:hypothetical protein
MGTIPLLQVTQNAGTIIMIQNEKYENENCGHNPAGGNHIRL